MKNEHILSRCQLFTSLLGHRLTGIKYYSESSKNELVEEPYQEKSSYDVADNYLVLVFSNEIELSFFANGLPVCVSLGDPMIYDGYNILGEIDTELSVRFEILKLEVKQISLFYLPSTTEFLALGMRQNPNAKKFDLALVFCEDAICEALNISAEDIGVMANFDHSVPFTKCEILLNIDDP